MNRIFRLIWNPHLAMYVPAPETGRGRGKSSGARTIGTIVLSAVSLAAYSMPMGGEITAGQGSIGQSGSAMTINQQSPNLAINWQSFGIGAAESVTFVQPSTSAIALNRVLGGDLSQIHGRLSANGQVWLLNPNGVLFGGGAQVNVGGLLASTLNISDADFLAGKRSFAGTAGAVTNKGAISAADGGYVALLGGKISNEGVIQARLGTVALGAGNQVTLDFAGDKLLSLQVDKATLDAQAHNKQLIAADGGTVLLSTRAASALLDTVVNNTGVIEARTIDSRNGTIKLLGGNLRVAGTLDASAPNGGDGGFVETSGAQVKVSDDARITTAAASGKTGQWTIAEAGNVTVAIGAGAISGTTLARQMDTTNVTIVAKGESDSGDVHVNDRIAWNSANSLTLSAAGNVNVGKALNSNGTGDVNLRADSAGQCVSGAGSCGTVRSTPQGSISANGGTVNIYYNPAGSSNPADANGHGPSYARSTDFSRYVILGGGSTLNAWMLVNDVNQLQAMNTNLAGSYAVGRDIDAAATAGWNGAAGFAPVGAGANFSGQFDGLGHSISGLTINRPASNDVGLFGRNAGQIRNVGMVAGAVGGTSAVGGLVGFNSGTVSDSYGTGVVKSHYGDSWTGLGAVGGLVGSNAGGTVSNSHSTAAVDGYYSVGGLVGFNSGTVSSSHSTGAVTGQAGTYRNTVGGLVGFNASGTVTNSHSTGTVHGYGLVGGLVGVNGSRSFDSVTSGTVSNSYSTGTVYGARYVGGLVGSNVAGSVSNSYSTGAVNAAFTVVGGLVGFNGADISNSYSTGAVGAADVVGGLVGFNGSASTPGTVSNSYSTGAVNGSYSSSASLGGLVGMNTSGTIVNSYWNITTSGQSTSAGGTGLTDAQMKQQASFIGFDFVNIWGIDEGVSYPFLLAH